MVIGATQASSVGAARSFVIWGEELSKKGRYAAAEKLYQRARGLVERTLGQQHPMMAEVLECYSELLVRTNRSAEGIGDEESLGSDLGGLRCWFLSNSHPGPPSPKVLDRTRRI